MEHSYNRQLSDQITEIFWQRRCELRVILREHLTPLCAEVDTNWNHVSFWTPNYRLTERQWDNPYTFDLEKTHFWVNTPSVGDVELDLNRVLKLLCPALLEALLDPTYDEYRFASCNQPITISNPEHSRQLIPGITTYRNDSHMSLVILWSDQTSFVSAFVLEDCTLQPDNTYLDFYDAERIWWETEAPDTSSGHSRIFGFEYLPFHRYSEWCEDGARAPRIDVTLPEISSLIEAFISSQPEKK